jgi:hypothetical protein
MDSTDRPVLKIALLVALIGVLMLALGACKTIGTPKVPAVATAAIDCALPSLWAGVDLPNLVTDAETAIRAESPIAALDLLVENVGEAEVDCIVAKLGSAKAARASGAGPSVHQQWLDREATKGMHVVNFERLPAP